MQIYRTELKRLSKFSSLRLSSYYELPKLKYDYDDFASFIDVIESGGRPKGGIKEEDYGQAVSLGGEQIGKDGTLNIAKLPYVPMDYYKEASKGIVKEGDILICKDGALTGKVCMVSLSDLPVDQVMINEHVYLIRSNERMRQHFLFYLMRQPFFQEQIIDLAYRKKAQPGLSNEHIRLIKAPEVPVSVQDLILKEVKKYEKEIDRLKRSRSDIQETLDAVLGREFKFDYPKFKELKDHTCYKADYRAFSNNPDVRCSVKYHRPAGAAAMRQLTSVTSKKIKHFIAEPIVLGASISPKDYDEDGEYVYISMAAIKSWEFDQDSASFVSNEYAAAKAAKTVQKDDIILARSGEGTIGKAAVIRTEDTKGIFADFTMRIRLKNYNPMFAYYYFRSMYFQYLIETYKKGLGNNTNIFPIVIQEFPMPDITREEQKRIVEEIEDEIRTQKGLEAQIAQLQGRIDGVILDAIML